MLLDWKRWINAQWGDVWSRVSSRRCCLDRSVSSQVANTQGMQFASSFVLCAAPLVCPQSVVEISVI
jgi:hypothetical protein